MEPRNIFVLLKNEKVVVGQQCSKCEKVFIGKDAHTLNMAESCCVDHLCESCGKKIDWTYDYLCEACWEKKQVVLSRRLTYREYVEEGGSHLFDLHSNVMFKPEQIREAVEKSKDPIVFSAATFRRVPKLDLDRYFRNMDMDCSFYQYHEHHETILLPSSRMVDVDKLKKYVERWWRKQPEDLGYYVLDDTTVVVVNRGDFLFEEGNE